MKVLIVDDSVSFRAALRLAVEDEGFEIVGEAANGRDALELFDAHSPQVVLVDLHMPVFDGLDLVAEIKKRSPATKVGVITVAGKSLMADAYQVGADAYIGKEEPLEFVISWLKEIDAG